MKVSSREKLAVELRKRIGRGSVATLRDWFARGCPGRDENGEYDVEAVCQWAAVEFGTRRGPGEPLGKPANWTERLQREQALRIRDQRRIARRELVPVATAAAMFDVFCVELVAQYDQMEIELARLFPAGRRTEGKAAVRNRCNQVRHRLADVLSEWARYVTSGTESAESVDG